MLAESSEMMRKANSTITIMEMSPKEKWLYENRMKYEHDKASWKHVGYQEGIEAGIQEGIDKGAYKKALETAKLLKQLGDSIQKIMQVTGLTKEEIEKL
ncbi:PD-(D/E)XK nuclease family transposase [Treponema denticola]|nr:PD-(D/E)XK nuclease family transposase [Treponema denticola]